MKLNPEFKVVYEKTIADERKLYAAKNHIPSDSDGELDPNLDALKDIKLVYEKNGKLYGSKENIPTANDTSPIVTVDGVDLFINEVGSTEALKDALLAGGSVVLSSNITGDLNSVAITSNTTLDLNNKSLSISNNNPNRPGFFQVSDNSTLTIKGTGTIKLDSYVINVGSVNNSKEGNAVIEDGVFESDSASVAQVEKGNLTIKGGSFKVNYSTQEYTINRLDNGTGTITISGGRFYKFDPSSNPEITVEGQVVAEGDWYVVKPND